MPIGMFDSGTGGLTVLERFLAKSGFRNEDFIYLADQANMPYGQYNARGKTDFLRELIVKDAQALLERKVKIIVIACNTATSYGLEDIRAMLEKSGTGVKVVGVVNAGVNAATDFCRGKDVAVGVLATQGTIAAGGYQRGLGKNFETVCQSGYGFAEAVDNEPDYVNSSLKAPRESYRGPRFGVNDCDIKRELLPVYNFRMDGVLFTRDAGGNYKDFQLNCPENYARFNLVSLVERHRKSGSRKKIAAIIMGCTHYPFYEKEMRRAIAELRNYKEAGKYVYRDIIANDVRLIDPAVYLADECYRILKKDGNLNPVRHQRSVEGFISVPAPGLPVHCLSPDGGFTYDFKYGREAGKSDVTFVVEPFSDSNFNPENRARITRLLPLTASYICD